jgi:DNA-binding GntR family transcriptional regulator
MSYLNSIAPEPEEHNQFDLFNQPEDVPAVVRSIISGRTSTITERFQSWLAENEDFYNTLAEMARQFLAETGSNKLGIQQLIEAARWNHSIRTRSADFKINNDYGSFLARLLMHDHADLVDVFDIRRADEADEWISNLDRRAA